MVGLSWKRLLQVSAVSVAVLGFTSCGVGGDKGGKNTTPAAGAAEAPVKPKIDRLVMGVAPPNEESNSPRFYGQPAAWQLRPMYEFLIGMDPQTGKPIPQLATEWKLEPDGKSYRFKLRQGVQFQDGMGEFTAKDVVFTWQHETLPETTQGETTYWKDLVQSVDIVNDYEVVFNLKRPDGVFLSAISEAQAGMEIRSKASYDKQGEPTMQGRPLAGTGPYQFKERSQGAFIRFERVPFKQWRVTPDFPEFEYRFQKEASTRLAALLAGEVQITSLPTDLQKQVEKQNFKTVNGRVQGLRTFMQFHCCYLNDPANPESGNKYPDSPLQDVRVRRALNVAINRDELNKAFFGGKGDLMRQCHLNPSRPGWNPEWQTKFNDEYGFNPAKARQLLADAGQSNLSTTLFVTPLPQYSGAEDVIEAVANYWRAIGVNVTLQPIDTAQYAAANRKQEYSNQINIVGTSAAEFIGTQAYSTRFGPPGGGPKNDADINRIYNLIRSEPSTEKQETLWRQLGDTMFTKQTCIPLFWLPAEAVVNPKFVADYTFPGSISGTWTHPEYIKAAK